MFNTVFMIEFADGTIGRAQWQPGLTDEEIQAGIEKTVWHSPVKRWQRCALSDFPQGEEGETFRDAWRASKAKKFAVGVDLEASKEIRRQQIRYAREKAFVALDRSHTVAIGKGDIAEANQIELERQRLRDLPADPAIEAAKSPADLLKIELPS